MIDLDIKYLDYIKNIVGAQLEKYKLYIFGSRVKGTAKLYSDIDIAVESDELTPKIKSKLEYQLENSTLPYEVDIIDLKTISKEFYNVIKNDLVLIDNQN